MITQKDLKDYEFENMHDYYEYIVKSRMNGQRKQAQRLYSKMSDSQQQDFLDHVDNEVDLMFFREDGFSSNEFIGYLKR